MSGMGNLKLELGWFVACDKAEPDGVTVGGAEAPPELGC